MPPCIASRYPIPRRMPPHRPIAISWPRASHCRSLRRSRMTRDAAAPRQAPPIRGQSADPAIGRTGSECGCRSRRLPVGGCTVSTALYKSPREEMDDVVWRMKRLHLDRGIAWNDMAIIAHDNATVRSFGERLRRDGVPVRYSSVTRPLKDEPFVQGLFALIELALLRRRGIDAVDLPLTALSSYVRARVATLMACPLVTAGTHVRRGCPGAVGAGGIRDGRTGVIGRSRPGKRRDRRCGRATASRGADRIVGSVS